jgi:DNA-binding NarL/FixJ family response regulator
MGYNILIVDSSDFLQLIFDELMSAKVTGTIAEAGNHYEAISFLNSLAPDMVAVDLAHPGLDGIDLIREVRAEAPSVRIVAIQPVDDVRLRRQAQDAGADAIIVKPYVHQEIEDVLDYILKRCATLN